MKKTISLILSLIMILALATTAWADEPELYKTIYSSTISEYDCYVNIREKSNEELEKLGFNMQFANDIKSNSVENELLKRSELSSKELKNNYGYSEEQINIIKNYNGEPIEKQPQLRGIFADMDYSVRRYIISGTTKTVVGITWEWSNKPFLCGTAVKDIAALRWEGTNSMSQPINLGINTNKSYCHVSYYDLDGSFFKTKKTKLYVKDAYEKVYSKIQMGINDRQSYAKKGMMKLYLDVIGNGRIEETQFIFAYAHQTVAVNSIGVSYPKAFSIGFTGKHEKMVDIIVRVPKNGEPDINDNLKN